jgi:hypothetical protein
MGSLPVLEMALTSSGLFRTAVAGWGMEWPAKSSIWLALPRNAYLDFSLGKWSLARDVPVAAGGKVPGHEHPGRPCDEVLGGLIQEAQAVNVLIQLDLVVQGDEVRRLTHEPGGNPIRFRGQVELDNFRTGRDKKRASGGS